MCSFRNSQLPFLPAIVFDHINKLKILLLRSQRNSLKQLESNPSFNKNNNGIKMYRELHKEKRDTKSERLTDLDGILVGLVSCSSAASPGLGEVVVEEEEERLVERQRRRLRREGNERIRRGRWMMRRGWGLKARVLAALPILFIMFVSSKKKKKQKVQNWCPGFYSSSSRYVIWIIISQKKK